MDTEKTFIFVARIFEIKNFGQYSRVTFQDLSGILVKKLYPAKLPSARVKRDFPYLINDLVLGFECEIVNRRLKFVNILWPGQGLLLKRQHSTQLIAANKDRGAWVAVISDVHVGSNTFLQAAFIKYLKAISRNPRVKYLIIAGDWVDGIQCYPGHDKDLLLMTPQAQYAAAVKLFNDYLRPDIKIIFSPGNHDYVSTYEPQLQLPIKYISDLKHDITILENPATFTVEGRRILIYHGRSFDPIIGKITDFSYNAPVPIMKYFLRIAHLSPLHDSRSYKVVYPYDFHVIDTLPDIFITGHIHKYAHVFDKQTGIFYVNAGTWQDITDYQKMWGIVPTPGRTVIFNLHDPSQVQYMDFSPKKLS